MIRVEEMDLTEVLDESIIDLDLQGTTKDEILRELSQSLSIAL